MNTRGDWYRYVKANYYHRLISRFGWPRVRRHMPAIIKGFDTERGFGHAETIVTGGGKEA